MTFLLIVTFIYSTIVHTGRCFAAVAYTVTQKKHPRGYLASK